MILQEYWNDFNGPMEHISAYSSGEKSTHNIVFACLRTRICDSEGTLHLLPSFSLNASMFSSCVEDWEYMHCVGLLGIDPPQGCEAILIEILQLKWYCLLAETPSRSQHSSRENW